MNGLNIMMHLKGFSLIELMVVIAIVAVLAAVAAPMYNSYIIKSRSMKVLDVIEGLSQKSIIYSQKHGVFANAYNLGLSTTVDATEVDNPAEFLPADYIQGVTYPIIELRDTSGVVPCGKKGSVTIIVDAHALGLREAPATGDGGVAFARGFYNVDGVIKTFNYYYAYADSFPSGYLVGDFIPGWTNMVIDDGQTMNPAFEAAGLDVQGAVCQ